LRRNYPKFQAAGAEILVIAPHPLDQVKRFFARHDLLFLGLADPERKVFQLYGVQSTLWSLGQRPGLFVVGKSGKICFSYVGAQQWNIPADWEVLAALERLAIK